MTADALNYRALTGAALAATLDDVARLRIAVFREYPYLYDGDLAYERRYLQSYRDNPSAIVVGAFDDGRLVGASTGTALKGHDPAFVGPVAGAGLDISRVFYCAESVLLAEYRGRGAGHAFFDMREARALASGHDISVFCAVIRSDVIRRNLRATGRWTPSGAPGAIGRWKARSRPSIGRRSERRRNLHTSSPFGGAGCRRDRANAPSFASPRPRQSASRRHSFASDRGFLLKNGASARI